MRRACSCEFRGSSDPFSRSLISVAPVSDGKRRSPRSARPPPEGRGRRSAPRRQPDAAPHWTKRRKAGSRRPRPRRARRPGSPDAWRRPAARARGQPRAPSTTRTRRAGRRRSGRSDRPSARARSMSTVYGKGSSSTSRPGNAARAIRTRTSAGATAGLWPGDSPTRTTNRSKGKWRRAASARATCPLCGGSKEPPYSPVMRARRPRRRSRPLRPSAPRRRAAPLPAPRPRAACR